MESREKQFKVESEIKAFDLRHRKVIKYNIGQYDNAFLRGRKSFRDLDNAREQASKIKSYSIQELENLLQMFEKNARGNGMEVLWAGNADDVLNIIRLLVHKEDINLTVKMKSMISEELELNHLLEKLKVEVFETDLGEFIVQTAGERPYHILTPAMHKSKEDVSELFNRKFGTEPDASPEKITAFVRELLRGKYVKADMGITGANFLIADTGSVGLTENEGNGMMTFSWPRIQVVIAGIEKVIPQMTDLGLFWPLLAVYGTGQNVTAYNTIISGPKKNGEADGPERMVVILLDGGRTRMMENPEMKQALNCIRCGACLNACPVYKNIGGFTYQTTYTGPIGSVISMYLDGSRDAGFLNFASSLCGKCSESCPVKIPIHELLLYNRNSINENTDNLAVERFFFRNFKRMMLKRRNLDKISAAWKNWAMRSFGMKVWGPRRIPLVFARESFNQSWKRKNR